VSRPAPLHGNESFNVIGTFAKTRERARINASSLKLARSS
jgi:hypothetical protein